MNFTNLCIKDTIPLLITDKKVVGVLCAAQTGGSGVSCAKSCLKPGMTADVC
jgi:hypothetical protein